jgi:hypothetical protein
MSDFASEKPFYHRNYVYFKQVYNFYMFWTYKGMVSSIGNWLLGSELKVRHFRKLGLSILGYIS